jgi:MFS family permease
MNAPWILCARIITGIGTGVFNAILPVWSAETSHKDHRGFFISFQFSINYLGLVTAYWLEYGISFVDGGLSSFRWRFPLAFQIVWVDLRSFDSTLLSYR